MVEMLHAYDKGGRIVKTLDKKSLIKEIQNQNYQDGEPNLAVAAVHLMLRNSNGDLYIVKRGNKSENPHLFCKSVGGHVQVGESYSEALFRETAEEIGINVLLTSGKGYEKAVQQIDTREFAVVRQIGFNPWMESLRIVRDGNPWVKPFRIKVYSGQCDAPVEFVDGEAEGMRLIPKDKLMEEFKTHPEDFTSDLVFLVKNYYNFF